MAFDFTGYEEDEELQVGLQPVEYQERPEQLGVGGILGDIAASPFRGAEGFAKSTYDLVDWIGQDILPDSYEGRKLGLSKTFAGSMLEGVTQFSLGFAAAGPAFKGATLAAKGAKGGIGVLKRLSISMGRGSVADFVSFDPHEARLANLMEAFPVLANPVSEYLAADADDSQAEGRFKNAIEGLMMGAATEGLMAGVRGLKLRDHGRLDDALLETEQANAGRSVEMANMEADMKLEADRRARFGFHETIDEDAVGNVLSKEHLDSFESGAFADKLSGDGAHVIGFDRRESIHFRSEDTPDGEVVSEVLHKTGFLKESQLKELAKEHPDASFVEYMEASEGGIQVVKKSTFQELKSDVPTEVRRAMNPVINNDQAHRAFRSFSPEAKQEFTEALENGSLTYNTGKPSAEHAKMLEGVTDDVASKAARMFSSIADEGGVGKNTEALYNNLVDSMKTPEDIKFVIEELPKSIKDIDGLKLVDIQEAGWRDMKAALARDNKDGWIDTAMKMSKKNNKASFRAIKHGMVMQEITTTLAKQTSKAADRWLTSKSNEDALVFQGMVEKWSQVNKQWDEHKYHAGLSLRAVRRDPADGLKVYLDSNTVRRNFANEAAQRDMFTEGNLKKLAEKMRVFGGDPSAQFSTLTEQAGKMSKLVEVTKAGRFASRLEAVYKNALLTNPATNVINIVGNVTSAVMHSSERWAGARGQQLLARGMGDIDSAKMYGYMAEGASRELRGLFTYSKQSMMALRSAWENGGKGSIMNLSKIDEGGQRFDPYQQNPLIEKGENEALWGMAQRLSKNIMTGAGNTLTPIVSIPGRLLGSADEAFKYGQYRASIDGQLWTIGRQQGLEGRRLEEYIEKRSGDVLVGGDIAFSQKAFRENAIRTVEAEERAGAKFTNEERIARIDEIHHQSDPWIAADRVYKAEAVIDPDGAKIRRDEEAARLAQLEEISEEAQRRALDSTFQTKHSHNSMVESLIRIQRNSPVMGPASGFILPFVRTPFNVTRFAGRRVLPVSGVTDLTKSIGKVLKARTKLDGELKMIHSSDPAEAIKGVEALGRVTTAAHLALMASTLSGMNMITGAAPQDRRKRDQLLATGWQPFSIRFGDTYVSYARVEPFSMFLGIFADINEARGIQAVNPDPNWEEQYMGALIVSVSANVADKTFFSGMSAFLEAATSGDEHKFRRMVGNILTPFVSPPGVAAINRTLSDDGALREMRTVADMMLGKMPGSSQTVDARRNVLGEELRYDINPADIINPFYHSSRKNDPILDELQSMTTGVDLPKSRLSPEIDLKEWRTMDNSRTLADVREEMVGTIEVGNKTLRQSLRDLMASNRYKKLSDVGPVGDFQDPRSLAFSSVIGKYRKAATAQILRENEDLRDAFSASKKLARSVKQGRISTEIAYNFMNPEG